jgi:Holliday junction resolvase
VNSRAKGARGEREVVKIAAHYGFDSWRTPNSGAFAHARGDINGIPGLHIEVKRREQIRMLDWWRQAENDCPAGLLPVVVWRTTRNPWRVSLPLDEWHGLRDLYGVKEHVVTHQTTRRVLIWEWVLEVQANCPHFSVPAIKWRYRNWEWKADVPLSDFLELWKRRVLT